MAEKVTTDLALAKAVDAAIKLRAHYPHLDALVATGKLIYKSGWYTAEDEQTFQLVVRFVTEIETQAGKMPRFKLAKLDG